MKKGIIFLLLLFYFLPFFIAQSNLGSIESKVNGVDDTLNKYNDKDYLAQEWNKILLQNKFISEVNTFLTNLNPIFIFLLNTNYYLSFYFLIILFLWIWFLLEFSRLFKIHPISARFSLLIGLVITIVISHLKVLDFLSSLILFLIFNSKEIPIFGSFIGGWIFGFVMFFLILSFFIFLSRFNKKFVKFMKEQRKREEEEETEIARKRIKKFSQKFNFISL